MTRSPYDTALDAARGFADRFLAGLDTHVAAQAATPDAPSPPDGIGLEAALAVVERDAPMMRVGSENWWSHWR